MSLRVNLILADEQRSGSRVNLRSFIRIATIVVPAFLVVVILQQTLSSMLLSSDLASLESRWSVLEPKQKQAERLVSQLKNNQKLKDELDSWATSRPLWNQLLAATMETTPADIQLTALRVTLPEPSVPPKIPGLISRAYLISIEGKTSVENSMQVVQSMERSILEHPVMAPLMDSVRVANFAADAVSSNEMSRVFTIQCVLQTLPIKEKR